MIRRASAEELELAINVELIAGDHLPERRSYSLRRARNQVALRPHGRREAFDAAGWDISRE